MDNIGPRGHFDQGRKFDENNEQQIWEFLKRSSLLRNYAARKLITLVLVLLCSTGRRYTEKNQMIYLMFQLII